MAKIIASTDVVKSRRGRKAELRPELVELFEGLTIGQAVLLDTEFPPASDTAERAKVRSIIAKNFAAAREDHAVPSVNFSGEGLAQVEIHPAKTAAAQAEAGYTAPAKGKAKAPAKR